MTISTAPANVGTGVDFLKKGSPVIDYTSLDRASLARDLRVWAKFQFSDQWTNFEATEFAVVFLEILSYIGDMVFYQINATIGESHPSTCIRRQSFIEIAKAYDFFLAGPVGSTVDVSFSSDVGSLPYPIGALTFKVQAANGTVFMPVNDVTITLAEQEVPMRAGDFQDDLLLATSTGAPAQKYPITQTKFTTPMLYQNVAGEGLVPTLSIRVDGTPWELKRLEADAQSTDEVYFIRTDESELVTVFFGDGVNGKFPATGAEIRYSLYLGTDQSSNVNERTLKTVLTTLPGLNSITNKLSASGGDGRQSLQSGKAALPASISTNNRAVTRPDFADVLFRNNAPSGIAKAAVSKGDFRDQIIWTVPNGNGPLTTTLRNDISEYMRDLKILGHRIDVRRATDIPLRMVLDVFVTKDHRPDDVVGRVRNVFVTEVINAIEAGTGAYDFNNLGLAGRDDEGNPQLTTMRVSTLLERLQISGLQKVVIQELRTIPVTKLPHRRLNSGNGSIASVVYLKPRDVPRREFRIVFTSATTYDVYRRIVGTSTLLTDNQMVDDRLNLDLLPERENAALSILDPITFIPDREGDSSFPVDSVASIGQVVQVVSGSPGSVFGSASVGAEYVLEFFDGTGSLPASTNSASTYTSSYLDLQWVVNAGTKAFLAGDEISFDVFPITGDVLLRADEQPLFLRDVDGAALDLITNIKTYV